MRGRVGSLARARACVCVHEQFQNKLCDKFITSAWNIAPLDSPFNLMYGNIPLLTMLRARISFPIGNNDPFVVTLLM